MSKGILETIDGRPTLRFTRQLAHPIERVWRAVSTHDELAVWFVAPMEFTHVGQHFEVMGQPGEVLRYEPPGALEWEWGGERFSFVLESTNDGTLLTFVHVFADQTLGADYASGWHFHFDRLEAHLAGQPPADTDPAQLVALNDRYAERFGLDRDVGRRIIAEHYGAHYQRD